MHKGLHSPPNHLKQPPSAAILLSGRRRPGGARNCTSGSSVADAFGVSQTAQQNRPYQTEGNHAYRGRHSVVADGRIALRAAVAASLAGRVAGEGHAVAVLDGAPVVDPVVGAVDVAGMALARVTAVPVRLVSRGREECALVLSQTFESVIRVRAEP